MFRIIDGTGLGVQEILDQIPDRGDASHEVEQQIVKDIIRKVKKEGDNALIELTNRFDGTAFTDSSNLLVSKEEMEEALSLVEPRFFEVLNHAAKRIKKFHEQQKRASWYDVSEPGIMTGQLIRPLNRVGVYVPGGRASYPSSVLMNIIPAKVAGVKNIVMVTPPQKNGKAVSETLVAAYVAGADAIYKVGGAQAIAALALGTETIQKVDKIAGPGNIYVALAKREVFGTVNIDMVAGPSEVLVIADQSANPAHVAADLLSQAEHDPMAASIFITDSKTLLYETVKAVERQLQDLPKSEIAQSSIINYGAFIVVDSLDKAFEISNRVAPEHLELALSQPMDNLGKVENAGSIFLGYFSPEPLGDYLAGPNHVLPTNGTARFFSALSVDDFVKRSGLVYCSKEKLYELKDDIIDFAEYEGLTAHANAIRARYTDE